MMCHTYNMIKQKEKSTNSLKINKSYDILVKTIRKLEQTISEKKSNK